MIEWALIAAIAVPAGIVLLLATTFDNSMWFRPR